jgi:hypothetical protein
MEVLIDFALPAELTDFDNHESTELNPVGFSFNEADFAAEALKTQASNRNPVAYTCLRPGGGCVSSLCSLYQECREPGTQRIGSPKKSVPKKVSKKKTKPKK